jgi:hypothetical protein
LSAEHPRHAYATPDGTPKVVESPQQGRVTVTKDYDNRVTAQTDDGCTWTQLARGNTASTNEHGGSFVLGSGGLTKR